MKPNLWERGRFPYGLLRKISVFLVFLAVSCLVMPTLGLQISQNIRSNGTVMYPQHGLGVWLPYWGDTIPNEAGWMVAAAPDYVRPRENISVILNWWGLHVPQIDWSTLNEFRSEDDIKRVEDKLKTVPAQNFWGIIFIQEENYRIHVAFNDDVNTTWFGEKLLGYLLYLQERPSATIEQWKDEMFLRMIRGFYNYFHEKGIKVGITACGSSIVTNYRNQSWSKGVGYYFGEPAMAFIREHYDFVILYTYSRNLEDFQWTKQYFLMIDQLFQKQKKLWILTRIWSGINSQTWEKEAIALEIKNCLDRNIVITLYRDNNPPFEEIWALIKKAIQLYDSKTPYFETYVYGKNLLMDYVGNTYGWVEVSS